MSREIISASRRKALQVTIPRVYMPDEVARRLGWSEQRLRNVARRACACRIIGRKMIFIDEDVAVLEGIANGEIDTPPELPKPKYKSSHVYFFQQGDFVKIGWSNKWRKRLIALQTATPHEIIALAIYRGGPSMERELHAKFAHHRARLEWFRRDQEILDYIEQNKANCLKEAGRKEKK